MAESENGAAVEGADEEGGDRQRASAQHSNLHTVLANLPYTVMVLLGASIVGMALEGSGSAWIAAGAYVVYGVAGAFWIIVFLCPYCRSYGQRSCPCGYGRASARLRPKGDTRLFGQKFRQHIPVIVPLWLIPVVVGAVRILSCFSWLLAVLLGVFVLEAFVLLPLLSSQHGCSSCPQRGVCPWMARRLRKPSVAARYNSGGDD